jgi:hypothetical protein
MYIQDMELETWINIFTAIGTIAAAGVGTYSVRLMARQVRYQFEPRLVIQSRNFQINISNQSLRDFFWKKPTKEAAYVNGGENDYWFIVRNIGNGSAYDIKIETELDFEVVSQVVV